MGRLTAKRDVHRQLTRGSQHDPTRWSVHVVDKADPGHETVRVELLRTTKPNLFLDRDQQLDTRVRNVLAKHASDAIDHARHGGLVVCAKDRVVGVDDEAITLNGIDRCRGRHGIDVGIKEQWRAGDCAWDPGVEIACVAVDPRAGVVLVRLDPDCGEHLATEINRSALFPWRRGESRER